jgi:hypothetical protein
MRDLDRLTKPEIWDLAFEAGRAQASVAAVESKPPTSLEPSAGWRSTEFVVTAATTIFAMWVGYRIIVDHELDLQRAIAAVTGVVTVAWYYVNRRTDLKKTAVEAGQTSIKTPAGSSPLLLAPPGKGGVVQR